MAAQIASPGVIGAIRPTPEPESWEDQSGGGASVTAVKPRAASETPLERIGRHTSVVVNQTHDIHAKVDKLEDRIDAAHGKIDAIFPVLADLRVGDAIQKTQNELILKKLDDQDRQKVQTETLLARTKSADIAIQRERTLSAIEIEEHDKIAQIETTKLAKAAEIDIAKEKRKAWLATAAKVFGALALLAIGYFAKKCGV